MSDFVQFPEQIYDEAGNVFAGFDGWLAFEASLDAATNGSLGLLAPVGGSAASPTLVDAVPVILLALAAVGVVVLGGQAVNMVRTTLRGTGFR